MLDIDWFRCIRCSGAPGIVSIVDCSDGTGWNIRIELVASSRHDPRRTVSGLSLCRLAVAHCVDHLQRRGVDRGHHVLFGLIFVDLLFEGAFTGSVLVGHRAFIESVGEMMCI